MIQLKYLLLEQTTQKPIVIQGTGFDEWQYKLQNSKYFVSKKGPKPNWILVTDPEIIFRLKEKFLTYFKNIEKTKKLKLDQQPSDNSFGSNLFVTVKKWLRQTFPNVAELFFTRNLTTDDFTQEQKNVMLRVVKNAIKRTGQNIGSTEYVDYGNNIVSRWFGPGGVKTLDMISNTLFANPVFMVATTLGRFSYKLINNKILITDVYDFKKIPDVKTTFKELQNLSYPEKIFKIMKDNNVNPYVAIRHLGYLENPEGSLKSKPKIVISLPVHNVS